MKSSACFLPARPVSALSQSETSRRGPGSDFSNSEDTFNPDLWGIPSTHPQSAHYMPN